MSALSFVALALAVLVLPAPSVQLARARRLSGAGRLADRGHAAAGARRVGGRARVVLVTAPIAATTVWLTAVAGPALGVACLAAGVTAAHTVRVGLRRRNTAQERTRLLTAVRLIVAELEAGAAPASALRSAAHAAGRHAAAFVAAADAVSAGGAAQNHLTGAALEPIGHAWRVASVAGAPVAAPLRCVADALADRVRLDGELRVAMAGPRSTALLLAALPAVGVALGAVNGADPAGWLLADGAGRAVCCAGVLLDAVGVLWSQRLMGRAEVGGRG